MVVQAAPVSSSIENLELVGTGGRFQEKLCSMLEDCPIFADLSWGDIQILAKFMQVYEAKPGIAVFHEGSTGDYLALILAGKVDISKEDQNLERKIVSTLGPGKILGEMAVVDGERRSATCTASEKTTLAILTKSNFEKILSNHPPLGVVILLKIARLMSQRLRATCGLLVDYLDE